MSITVPKRHPKRVRVMLTSVLESAGGRQKVRVRDISRAGMLLEAISPPTAGEVVRLAIGARSLEGKVAWQEGEWCGVTFSRTLDANVWDAFSQPSLTVTMPRQYRHDRIANEEAEPIALSTRMIRFARNTAMSCGQNEGMGSSTGVEHVATVDQ